MTHYLAVVPILNRLPFPFITASRSRHNWQSRLNCDQRSDIFLKLIRGFWNFWFLFEDIGEENGPGPPDRSAFSPERSPGPLSTPQVSSGPSTTPEITSGDPTTSGPPTSPSTSTTPKQSIEISPEKSSGRKDSSSRKDSSGTSDYQSIKSDQVIQVSNHKILWCVSNSLNITLHCNRLKVYLNLACKLTVFFYY